LPDIAHASIASSLPDGNKASDSRLRVSEVSRATLESYGDTVIRMNLRFVEDSGAAALVALLRRQEKLERVVVDEQEAIPSLCLAIVQDCCRRLQEIKLGSWRADVNAVLTRHQSDLLAAAFEKDAALSALRILHVNYTLAPDGVSKLTRALRRGTAPQRQDLHFPFLPDARCRDDKMTAVADMLEARARIPGCKRLERFNVNRCWLSGGLLATRIRLLRVLLPSILDLPDMLTWNQAYEPSFIEARAPYVTALDVCLQRFGGVFSWKML